MLALVTGGTGFIGRHVVKALMGHAEVKEIVSLGRQQLDAYRRPDEKSEPGWTYIENGVDVTNENDVREMLAILEPDFIFHLAANPIVKKDESNPCKICQTNIVGTHHLLEWCKPGTRFVYVSSATVYGDLRGIEDGLTQPTSVYAATKLASEHLVNVYARHGKISRVIFRLVANVGPGASHGLVYDILRKLRSDSAVLDLIGDEPGSIKPFTHVADTAKFIVEATLNPSLTGTVNVASGSSISVDMVADAVMDTCGIHKPKQWLGHNAGWVGDNRNVSVATSTAYVWGFRPECISSEQAVVKAVQQQMGVYV